jgi:hypothetical protein
LQSGAVTRWVLSLVPLISMVVLICVVFRLVFVKGPPEARPDQESHGHLRE